MKPTTRLMIDFCVWRRNTAFDRVTHAEYRQWLAGVQRKVRAEHGTKTIVQWLLEHRAAGRI